MHVQDILIKKEQHLTIDKKNHVKGFKYYAIITWQTFWKDTILKQRGITLYFASILLVLLF